jgi:hypothetical protein
MSTAQASSQLSTTDATRSSCSRCDRKAEHASHMHHWAPVPRSADRSHYTELLHCMLHILVPILASLVEPRVFPSTRPAQMDPNVIAPDTTPHVRSRTAIFYSVGWPTDQCELRSAGVSKCTRPSLTAGVRAIVRLRARARSSCQGGVIRPDIPRPDAILERPGRDHAPVLAHFQALSLIPKRDCEIGYELYRRRWERPNGHMATAS